jgi:Uma2 family endonuclease
MNAPFVAGHPAAVKLTVDNYLMLDRAGALAAYGKTELLDGVIYIVSPQHSPHFMLKTKLFRRLADAVDALDAGLHAWVEGSLDFRPNSCPEPDIFITQGAPQASLTEREIVALVIEVSSTSLDYDLSGKAALYAANGVPEYWVVDVAGAKLHRMWSPGPNGYGEQDEVWMQGRIESVSIAGLGVEVDDLP